VSLVLIVQPLTRYSLYDVSCVFAATKPFVDSKVVSDLLPEIALKALSYPNAKLPVTIKHYFR
jgi:hypothetical protein